MFGTGLTRLLPRRIRNPVRDRINNVRDFCVPLGIRMSSKGAHHHTSTHVSAAGPIGPAQAPTAPLTNAALDQFMLEIDHLGGPDSPAAATSLREFTYQYLTAVDDNLDPYSDWYWQQQITLYREISGRDLDQSCNEFTEFDLEHHVVAVNSYASADPKRMAIHYARLGKLLMSASLPINARVLDLGCGWGLTSEFLATLGCRVTAVDINNNFVELVARRSLRFSYGIKTINSNFDDLDLQEKFDLILFYECLHHAIKPWELLQKVSGWLTLDGKIALGGEPIQSIWWRNWGLRLDGLSVYCMRKFGWFESGWSKEFIIGALTSCGLSVLYQEDTAPEVGPIIIASRKQ
jgi:SAM-dependent methyltransferase